jgi:hypothetical protein
MRPHPKNAETDPSAPRAWSTDDRTGFVGNQHKLCWQYEWRGTRLENLRILTLPQYLDKPQRQLGSIILPPDPVGILNARPERYYQDEHTYRVTLSGQQRYQLDGVARIESNVQSGSTFSQALATDPYQSGIITSQGPGGRGQDIIFNP